MKLIKWVFNQGSKKCKKIINLCYYLILLKKLFWLATFNQIYATHWGGGFLRIKFLLWYIFSYPEDVNFSIWDICSVLRFEVLHSSYMVGH